MKKLMAVCLTLILILGLCSCDKAPSTPQEVLAASMEKMMNMNSAEFSMDMTLGMEAEGVAMPMTITGQGEMLMDPQILHMAMDMDMLIIQMSMEMYTTLEDENATTYVGVDMGQGMQWVQQQMEMPKNPALSTLEALQMITDLREAPETQTVDGVEVIRYDGVITGESVQKALEGLDVTGELDEAMGENPFENLYPSLGMQVTYYIEKESLMIREVTMDMTELMAAMMEVPEMADSGIGFSQVSVSMRYSGFDTVESIVIPEEALNAPAA